MLVYAHHLPVRRDTVRLFPVDEQPEVISQAPLRVGQPILLRNVEGSMMTFPPVINEQVEFAGALGLICAFRAAVAITKPGAAETL